MADMLNIKERRAIMSSWDFSGIRIRKN